MLFARLRRLSLSRYPFSSSIRHLRSDRNPLSGAATVPVTMTFLPPFKYMRGDELAELMKSDAKAHADYIVVDVRDDDRIGGHILNSMHSPSFLFDEQVQDLVERTKHVPKVVFHCALSQARGPKAARIYSQLRSELQEREGKEKDFDVFVLRGGFTEFQLRHRNDTMLIEAWDKDTWNNQFY